MPQQPRRTRTTRHPGVRFAAFAALTATVAALAACGSGGDAPQASAGGLDRVTLQLQVPENGLFSGFWYGKEKGIYAKYGIDLTIKPGVTSQAAMDAVTRGDADFTTSSFPSVVVNQAAGNPVVGIAEIIRGGNQGLLVDADSGISSWSDLPGKKVIITTGSSQKPLYDAALSAVKVDPKTVNVVNVSQAVLNQTFASGGADAALTVFPFSEPQISKQRKVKALSFSEAGIQMPGYVLISSTTYVGKSPDVTKRFVEATLASWAAAYKNRDDAVATMLKSNPALNKDDAGATFAAVADKGCGVDDNGSWFGDFTTKELDGGLKILVDTGLVKDGAVDLAKGFPRDALDAVPSANRYDCSTLGSGS